MVYRELGKTGKKVSVVGFGGMRFFQKDEPTALATVRRCLEVGINFFETGSNYGQGRSEELLGKALEGHVSRDEIVLANKAVASTLPDGKQVRLELETALRREKTDYFDLFSFWGTNTPQMLQNLMRPSGGLDEMIKAREQGLIGAIGITTHARPDWIRDFAESFAWDCVTLKEHMLYSRQQEVIAHLAHNGASVIIMSPLAGGVVALPGPEVRQKLSRHDLSPAVLGLRYLVSNPNITTAISGMMSTEEVEENSRAGVTGEPLDDIEKELIEYVQEKTTALGQKFCTSCGYCQPCPQEVNIPGVFRLWNLMRGYGNKEYSQLEYLKIKERRHWADFPGASAEACSECGECQEQCPEGLPIIEDLKRAHADLAPC